MPGLSRSDVEHVAHLARLGLTDAELGVLEGQLNHILDQYTKLAELDTDAIPARRGGPAQRPGRRRRLRRVASDPERRERGVTRPGPR